jgi:hypothetical protein
MRDIGMPSSLNVRGQKHSLIDTVLTQKLRIKLGDSSIDRNILQAGTKMGFQRTDLLSLSELSRCGHPFPKSARCG